MPTLTLATFDFETVAGAEATVSFSFDTTAGDTVHFSFLTTRRKSQAFGIALSVDTGTGTPEIVTLSDVAPVINISGSLAGFGVREMSLQMFGRDHSIWKTAKLRGMRSVILTGLQGTAGNLTEYPLFDGWTRDPSYDADENVASLACQDGSLQHIDDLLFLNVGLGTGITRLQLLTDIFTESGWPIGTIDLPNTDGGYVFKPISEGGERRLAEWLPEFLAPVGRRALWRDGQICVERFDTSGEAVVTLKPPQIRSLKMSPPATNAPNVIEMTSEVYDYRGPAGRRTLDPVIEEVIGDYTPEVAINVQNHTTGVVSATGLTGTLIPGAVISRTITTDTVEGGALIYRVKEEWGWVAPLACNKYQDDTGAISHNPDFDVYEFATSRTGLRDNVDTGSGYWRTQSAETFQLLRRTTTNFYFNTEGRMYAQKDTIRELGFIEIPSGYHAGGTYAVSTNAPASPDGYFDSYLTADGRAHMYGREVFKLLEANRTAYSYDGTTLEIMAFTESMRNLAYLGGRWVFIDENEALTGSGYPPFGVWRAGEYNVASALAPLYLGSVATSAYPVYESADVASIGPYTTEAGVIWQSPLVFYMKRGASYITVRPTHPNVTATAAVSAYAPDDHQVVWTPTATTYLATNGVMEPNTGTEIRDGGVPVIDEITEGAPPRPTLVTLRDYTRIALADSLEVIESQQNDFCETNEQLHLAGFDVLREYAPVIDIETDVDWRIEEGSVIEVLDPRLSTSARKLLVEDWSASINCATGENSMNLTCKWFPPELLTAPPLTAEVLE